MNVLPAIAATVLLLCASVSALGPAEVLVVYNESFPGSKELADYYAQKRAIPKEHVLGIKTSTTEQVARAVYFDTLQAPIKAWLDQDGRYGKIRCILLMRGVPLVYGPVEDVPKAQAQSSTQNAMGLVEIEKKKLEAEKNQLDAELKTDPARANEVRRKIEALDEKLAEVETRLKPLKEAYAHARAAWEAVVYDTAHSVESGLAVMYFPNVPVKGWVSNPLNYRAWSAPGRERLPKTFITCRLDGPTDVLVRRVIDDSIWTEERGLQGVAYFDARGLRPGVGPFAAYAGYDALIRAAAAMVEKTGLKTVLDDGPGVFAPNSCPHAALYCGWYSLERYVPAFQWVKGAVGFHAASWEARTLRDPNYQGWCKRMLEEGAAATFGPTWEPFLSGFPDPSPFFAFLLTGRYTIAEAYWYTTPMASWTLTLVADPLYTPFKKNPKMTVDQLKAVIEPKP